MNSAKSRDVTAQSTGVSTATAFVLWRRPENPIEDLDGGGLLAVLSWLDLDASAWLASGPAYSPRYTAARYPEKGPVAEIKSEHYRRYAKPQGEWLSQI